MSLGPAPDDESKRKNEKKGKVVAGCGRLVGCSGWRLLEEEEPLYLIDRTL